MRLLIGVLALLPALAFAETGYVTDNLRLRMYENADLTGALVETLESGAQFEVLARNNQTANVELPDGRQGYLSAGYIVFDKPAKLIVSETEAEKNTLAAELAQMRESFAEPAALIESLQKETTDLQSGLTAAASRNEALVAENEKLAGQEARYQYSLPYTWVGGAIIICLIAGFLLGLWWVDRQSRRRHGGIRVL